MFPSFACLPLIEAPRTSVLSSGRIASTVVVFAPHVNSIVEIEIDHDWKLNLTLAGFTSSLRRKRTFWFCSSVEKFTSTIKEAIN